MKPGTRLLIRNIEGWAYLEVFLVSAVAAVLAIRLFLEVSGYPQLGGRGLHIAHMLWGGLLMLAAIIILLQFLSRASRRLASAIAGFGFGTFIDEVGKFVTADNDYFFRPAVALIYVTFVAVYLAAHTIRTAWDYTTQEYTINALREMEEVALHDLSEEEKARALLYIARSDRSHPLVPALERVFAETALRPAPMPPWLDRVKGRLGRFYRRMACYPQFPKVITAFFLIRLGITLASIAGVIFFAGLRLELNFRLLERFAGRFETISLVEAAQLLSSLAAAGFTAAGVLLIRRSRLRAFGMFERALLVSIFVTRVFTFYQEQFWALFGLAADILILAAVRFASEQEQLAAGASVQREMGAR